MNNLFFVFCRRKMSSRADETSSFRSNLDNSAVNQQPTTNVYNRRNLKRENPLIAFVKRNPVFTVLILAISLVLIILAIVLPLTLIKKREDREIRSQCPDGKNSPRIDCLPDKENFLAQGSSLESVCSRRKCCWSSNPESGGPNCAYPANFGFRNYKIKENSHSTQWMELLRMNSPQSFAKSDIANLEVRVEMHTDNRLRIRVNN